MPEGRAGELEERLRGEGADLDELEALRAHARSMAEARGASDLAPAPGPVGSSIIADILTFDED